MGMTHISQEQGPYSFTLRYVRMQPWAWAWAWLEADSCSLQAARGLSLAPGGQVATWQTKPLTISTNWHSCGWSPARGQGAGELRGWAAHPGSEGRWCHHHHCQHYIAVCKHKTQHSYFDSPGVHQGSLWHLTKTTPVLDLLWMPQPGLLPTPAPWSCPTIHALHPLPMDVLAFWRADASPSLLPPPTFHFFHLETFPH